MAPGAGFLLSVPFVKFQGGETILSCGAFFPATSCFSRSPTPRGWPAVELHFVSVPRLKARSHGTALIQLLATSQSHGLPRLLSYVATNSGVPVPAPG